MAAQEPQHDPVKFVIQYAKNFHCSLTFRAHPSDAQSQKERIIAVALFTALREVLDASDADLTDAI